MVYLILGSIGLLVGMMTYRSTDSFYGLALGLMAAEIYVLRKRLTKIEESMTARISEIQETVADAVTENGMPVPPVSQPIRDSAITRHDDIEISRDLPDKFETPPTSVSKPVRAPIKSRHVEKNTFIEIPTWATAHLKKFFTTGNVVAKIGGIVLFFGFAFLLKFAAQRNLVPIEFRLIGVFLVGLGLIVTGWRLREKKMIYALLLQGCGIGVLYLTVYAAARFYHLLPYGFSFAVMLCLVVLSGLLAVLQDAKYMAVSGIIGGFLAPVLMSTGSGSHVVLFSYYALLNLGIVGIAWYKAWRELNLVGFVFTFVIASLWGGRYYQPQYFSTTEPFLILFFLFYVAISVLHALRQPLNLRGYVDGTLVFGVPLVAFGLQYNLIRNIEYGLAISALSLGLFYILLAATLWRRRITGLRMVTESFLAFGVVFGSLAIPLALDGRWTSAAWALEGCAILWVGVRQNRLLPRIFGVLLQAGAGVSFLLAGYLPSRELPLVNSFFVGCIFISLAGLFSSRNLAKQSEPVTIWEQYAVTPLMVWGLAWWFGGAFVEIERFVPRLDWGTAVLIHSAISFLVMDITSRRLGWKQFSYPSLVLLPVIGITSLYHLTSIGNLHFFSRIGFIAWGVAFLVQYRLLFTCEKTWPENLLPVWHQLTLWLLIFILTIQCSFYTDVLIKGDRTWQYCIWGVLPATSVIAILSKGNLLSWPIRRFHDVYFGVGTAVPIAYLFFWVVLVNLYHGNPAPLPFVPLINPIELSQTYLLFVVLYWMNHQEEWIHRTEINLDDQTLRMIVYGAGFLLLNTMVARTLHFWAQVPYNALGLYRSMLFQAALSILWGITALVVTLSATRKRNRVIWVAGASILTLVVLKLFVVDLSGTGTIARIVSFLAVGSLMLLIGYFSPLPPARTKETS